MRETDSDKDEDQALSAFLQRLQPPPADPRFIDQAIARARHEAERRRLSDAARSGSRAMLTGFSAAVVAGLALLFVANLFFGSPGDETGRSDIPGVTIALAEEETVNLVFSSGQALQRARLTLILPPGIELAGFPGQRRVQWDTSLEQGKNLLPLTFIATAPTGGDVVATLEHDSRARTYRVHIDIA